MATTNDPVTDKEISLWLFEIESNIHWKVELIIGLSQIMGLENRNLLKYLEEEQKKLIQKVDRINIVTAVVKIILDKLHSDELPSFLRSIINNRRSIKTPNEFNETIDVLLDVFEILLTIEAIKEKIKEIKNPGNSPPPLKYEDLFHRKADADWVKEVFKSEELTVKGKWKGDTNKKNELLIAFFVLRELGIIKQGFKTPNATVFYIEFGLQVGKGQYIEGRSLRTEPKNDRLREFFTTIFTKHR